MGKEEISSNGQDVNKLDIKPVEAPQNTGAQNKARVKSDTKHRKRKVNPKKKLEPAAWSIIGQIGVAFLGLIGTITVAWFGYQASLPKPTAVAIFSATPMPSATPIFTETATVFTNTPFSTILPSFTNTIPVSPVPSETITPLPQPKLIVLLTANKNTGNAPLKVKMDARASYLTAYDGQKYVCRNGPCSYAWKVYFNDQQVGNADNSGGTFDYTFGRRGTYKVTVWICRGRDKVDCGGGAIQITAT
jgi:hypothetical protein